MVSASACVGFTLPGIIDETRLVLRNLQFCKPARGPHDIRRMSFAII